jgi:hypothetical protein
MHPQNATRSSAPAPSTWFFSHANCHASVTDRLKLAYSGTQTSRSHTASNHCTGSHDLLQLRSSCDRPAQRLNTLRMALRSRSRSHLLGRAVAIDGELGQGPEGSNLKSNNHFMNLCTRRTSCIELTSHTSFEFGIAFVLSSVVALPPFGSSSWKADCWTSVSYSASSNMNFIGVRVVSCA